VHRVTIKGQAVRVPAQGPQCFWPGKLSWRGCVCSSTQPASLRATRQHACLQHPRTWSGSSRVIVHLLWASRLVEKSTSYTPNRLSLRTGFLMPKGASSLICVRCGRGDGCGEDGCGPSQLMHSTSTQAMLPSCSIGQRWHRCRWRGLHDVESACGLQQPPSNGCWQQALCAARPTPGPGPSTAVRSPRQHHLPLAAHLSMHALPGVRVRVRAHQARMHAPH